MRQAAGAATPSVGAEACRSKRAEQGRAAMERQLPEHLKGLVNIEPLCGAPRSAMYTLFSHVERRHGSVDGYLDSIGVDAELRARCASALTDDAHA